MCWMWVGPNLDLLTEIREDASRLKSLKIKFNCANSLPERFHSDDVFTPIPLLTPLSCPMRQELLRVSGPYSRQCSPASYRGKPSLTIFPRRCSTLH